MCKMMQRYRLGGVHPSPTLVLFNDVGLFPPAVSADEGELF